MTKDIYIELLEDITGLKIDPAMRILQSQDDVENATQEEKEIDEALRSSRDVLCKKLKIKTTDMLVGSPPAGTEGYVEPCPIQYTGDIKKQKFHCVFIGLNPHLDKERWRIFPSESSDNPVTFADLANFHHPDHIYYDGCDTKKYNSKSIMKNNYWRVMGHMKYFEPNNIGDWSPYYKHAIRMHLALLPDSNCKIYNKFNDMVNAYNNSTEKLLQKLTEFPMANIELLPYKTEGISIKKFNELLKLERYNSYLKNIINFIKEHTTDDAYIIATNSVSELYEFYNFLRKHLMGYEEYRNKKNDLYTYCKSSRELTQQEKQFPQKAPMYLTKWGKRRVIVTSPISGSNAYSWIYNDFSNGWIDAIKNDFPEN